MHRLRPNLRSMLLCPVLASALGGCVQAATEVIVVVDTDAPANRALSLSVAVGAGSAATPAQHTWTRGPGVSGSITLPASFAVVPAAGRAPGGDVALTLHLHVEAGAAGEPALDFDRRALFVFTPHQTTVLRVFLPIECAAPDRGCVGVPEGACTRARRCADADQTCDNTARCASALVTPVALSQDDASTALPAPDGPRADATTDATRADVPGDATPTDACPAGAACLPGATRTTSCGPCATQTDTCSASCAWTAGTCSGSCCTPHAGCAGGNPIGGVCAANGDDGCGQPCTCDGANGESCNAASGYGSCCHNANWFCADQGECCPGLTCLGNICQ